MSDSRDNDPLLPQSLEEPSTRQDQEDSYYVKINNGSLYNDDTPTHQDDTPTHQDQRLKDELFTKKLASQQNQFHFVQPVAVRSLTNFFQLPRDAPSCDSVSRNFSYNLWYFQVNYAIVLVCTVLLAMQIINCRLFNFEIYITVVVMAMVCLLNNVGCKTRALGRRIKLSEQLTAIFLVMALCNGLLPEAFDFIFFFGAYLAFVFIHASIIQVRKSYLLKAVVFDV